MPIYFFQFEAVPQLDNPERDECAGAYINCWVNSIDVNFALTTAHSYVNNEGWEVISSKEQFIANREMYEDDPETEESLECFDQAMSDGIAAIFYIWPYDG
ncbi:hypothetical protein ACFDTO_22785 [Microbacteriaceae bacterium 4G12]